MKRYTVATMVLVLGLAPVHGVFAQYPGEPNIPDRTYDPVYDMNYDRQFGMPNEIVRQAQEVLRDEGYYDGPLDGVRNPRFLTAIWNFQRSKGLPTTTHLDAPTLAALNVSAPGAALTSVTPPSNFAASP